MPIGVANVELAGKPALVGGCALWAVASVIGFFGLLIASLFFFLGSGGTSVFGAVFGLITVIVSGLVYLAGRKLRQEGGQRATHTKERAVFAHAQARRGFVKPRHISRLLQIPESEADALLTAMAKSRPDEIDIDVDDRGELSYVFLAFAPPRPASQGAPPRIRVETPAPPTSSEHADIDQAEAEADAALEAGEPHVVRRR